MPRYEIETLVTITGLDRQVIIECVERRLVEAEPAEPGALELREDDLARLRRIHRLLEDFDVGLDAVGLILELRDEVEELRRQARIVEHI
jgi:hypothetical protein